MAWVLAVSGAVFYCGVSAVSVDITAVAFWVATIFGADFRITDAVDTFFVSHCVAVTGYDTSVTRRIAGIADNG